MLDEPKLIAESKGGNAEAFSGLYDEYIKKIYNFVYFRTHHKQTAEDITSLVFTKAFERIRQFDPNKAKFSTWLYQIARNSVIDHYRLFKSSENIEDVWDLASSANVEKDADTVLAMEKVQAYLKELPALQRDVIIMRLWDGLSHKEIANVLDITEGHSKVNFSRAINKLRAEIGTIGLIGLLAVKNLFLF